MAVYHKAIVKSVLSGDTVALRGKPKGNQPPPERQLNLAYVEAPRLRLGQNSKTDDEPFAFESREFLRKLLVGKEVSFCVAYTTPNSREFGSIFINNENVTFQALREGWVKVRERKTKDDGDELAPLLSLEQSAKEAAKGIWGDKGNATRTVNYALPGDPSEFLHKYRGTSIDGIVEQIRDASTLRVLLLLPPPEPQQYITLMISGIKAPTVRKGIPEAEDLVEPFGEEAKFFVESKLLQRNVKVVLEGQSSNNQALIGSVLHPAGNIAEALVSVGLAKVVDWSITLVTDGPVKLRAAEKLAKEKRLRIWQDHVARIKAGGEDHEFSGTVTKIISGDTLQIRVNRSGVEKKLQLSSIRQPKPKDPKLPEYNFEAKELLRKRLIGKTVNVTIDYEKPAQDNFEARECATVKLGETNIAEALVERGLAHVIRHKKDDEDRSSAYDQLLIAEQKAIKNGKGIHSGKEPPVYRIGDASENSGKARQFLHSLQRSG
ncbi:7415_t:CDS:1, partial [Ambispora leptoticha]